MVTTARLNRIVTLAGAGMFLCWFDVLNGLVMPVLSRKPLPIPLAALILLWSGLVSFVAASWLLRRIGIIVVHAFGFLFALILVLQISGDPAYHFYDFDWVTQVSHFSWVVWQWLKFIVNLIWAGLLYYFGCQLHLRKTDVRTVGDHLDIGISAFLVVLIVKLIAEHKGVVISYEHTLGRQLVCFMMLGLFSMGVARNRTSHRSSIISYYKGAGLVMSFGLLAAVFGTAMAILFLPDLIEGALWVKEMFDRSRPSIEHAATLLANSDLLTFWFGPAVSNAGKIFAGAKGLLPPLDLVGEGPDPFYLKMVFYGGLFFGLVVLWFVSEWVLFKQDGNNRKPGPWVVLRIMARRLKRFLLRIVRLLFSRSDPLQRVEQYYRLFKKWGARSGLPRAAYETPNEYGARLADSFPEVAREIDYLIALFNNARYGGIPSQREQFKRIRAGWKRLRSPLLWPVRARLWLFRARV